MLTTDYPLVPLDPAHKAAKEQVCDVLDKLETFGSTEALALHFAEQGIRGVMGCADTCPVSKYLQRELDTRNVQVSTAQVWVGRGGEPDVYQRVGRVVAEFVSGFDSNRYPELTTGRQQQSSENLVVLG